MRHVLNREGLALPIVLVVTLILTLLGTTLWYCSTTDRHHVSLEEKRLKAYYLARSGAEAVAQYIVENYQNLNVGELNALIDASISRPVPLGEGTFQVDVNGDVTSSIEIVSYGKINGITRTVKLTLKVVGIPEIPENADDAGALGWLNGGSHVIDKHTDKSNENPVVFKTGNMQDYIKITTTQGNNNYTRFSAPSIYFVNMLSIDDKSEIILDSPLLVFYKKVVLKRKNNRESNLILSTNEQGVDGAIVDGGEEGLKYGKVYFNEDVVIAEEKGRRSTEIMVLEKGAYFFPNGVIIPDEYDRLIPTNLTNGYKKIWNVMGVIPNESI